jgi:hypothetical protein
MSHNPEKASERIFIRVTPTDKRIIAEAGGENMSEWAKRKLREAANEQQRKTGVRTR